MSEIADVIARVQDLTARIASTQALVGDAFADMLRSVGVAVDAGPVSPLDGAGREVTEGGGLRGLLLGTRWYGRSTSGPPLPAGIPNELVSWRGVTMNVEAMRSFQQAGEILGQPIVVTGAYRSEAQQADLYRRKPGLAAPPGSSYHERGLAIDINTSAYGGTDSPQFHRVVEVLESLGWHFFSPSGEPWHASYLVTG
jgi:hypothetical protein